MHRWKVKANSIINYLDYNKAMNMLRLITLNIQKRVNEMVTDISIMILRFTTQITRILKV